MQKTELLRDVKKVLEQEKCKDESSISLYDLLKLIEQKKTECYELKQDLFSKIANCSWIEFYEKNMKLLIDYFNKMIYFIKKDGDLIVLNEDIEAYELLVKFGNEISEYYDKCIENIDFYTECMSNIKSINSNFIVNSDFDGITISENFNDNSFFELTAKAYATVRENYDYNYKCNSYNIISVFRGNEEELFKRVFVKISDCPKWAQTDLYEIRKKQLEKQERNEYLEMKKQKRLEFFRKLNPFQKN